MSIMPKGEKDPVKFHQINRIYISFNLKPVADYLKTIPATALLSINRYTRESNTKGAYELNKILGKYLKTQNLYPDNKNSKDKSSNQSSPFITTSSNKSSKK